MDEGPSDAEIRELVRNATPEAKVKAPDYLRRCQSPDPSVQEKAMAELMAEVANLR